jgi:hypothetical protein
VATLDGDEVMSTAAQKRAIRRRVNAELVAIRARRRWVSIAELLRRGDRFLEAMVKKDAA